MPCANSPRGRSGRGRARSPTGCCTDGRSGARPSWRRSCPGCGPTCGRMDQRCARVRLDGHPSQLTKVIPAMSVDSVFPQLEALLPHVQKPIQYVGGELNSTVKPWDGCDVRWALMYPDAYEVGLPNQGVQILY